MRSHAAGCHVAGPGAEREWLRVLPDERIRQAAASGGAGVVDIASADDDLHASAANFVNCNHLSEAGNEIVAQVFVDALEH